MIVNSETTLLSSEPEPTTGGTDCALVTTHHGNPSVAVNHVLKHRGDFEAELGPSAPEDSVIPASLYDAFGLLPPDSGAEIQQRDLMVVVAQAQGQTLEDSRRLRGVLSESLGKILDSENKSLEGSLVWKTIGDLRAREIRVLEAAIREVDAYSVEPTR